MMIFPLVSLFLDIEEDGGASLFREPVMLDYYDVASTWTNLLKTLTSGNEEEGDLEIFVPNLEVKKIVEKDEIVVKEEKVVEEKREALRTFDEWLTNETVGAFKEGRFELFEEGLGGTYLVKGKKGEKLAVFKPGEEEAGSSLNPKKNFIPIKKGVKPGEGFWREVAAYMMDHEHLAGVPFTQIVELDVNGKKKLGSLQKFVSNEGSMTDFGYSMLSVSDVQKIAQLDIRLFNLDRNEENLLITKENGKITLIPIDHAFSIPESLDDDPFFNWMHWKQAKQPISKEILEYIDKISIEKDEEILKSLNFSEGSIKIMKMSTLTLKIGAKNGYNLHDIATFLTRPSRKELSPLEEIEKESKSLPSNLFWEHFMKRLSERMCPKQHL